MSTTDRLHEFRSCVTIFSKMNPTPATAAASRHHHTMGPLSTEAIAISTSLARTSELTDNLERDLTSSGGAFDSRETQVVEEISLIGRRLKDAETRLDALKIQSSAQSLNSMTRKHWENLLGHSLHPRFKTLAKRFQQANAMRVASLQSMHNRHEKYFTKDLVHLAPNATLRPSPRPPLEQQQHISHSRGQQTLQQQPLKNSQLPYQKLKSTIQPPSSVGQQAAASTTHQSTAPDGHATSGRTGHKQYYQSPYQTATTATTASTTAPGYIPENTYNAGSSQYSSGLESTARLRNRRAPGGSGSTNESGGGAESTKWKSRYVTDNPYVQASTSNPYSRTNPYADGGSMNRPPPQNGGMMMGGGNQGMSGMSGMNAMGGQQHAYSTSNSSRARERVENAKMVAQQFAQVGEMTATLAEIVEQQDEWIADLETETDEAAGHVERGQTELLKLWQNVSGDRGLMLKLFAVLIFFIILFFWLQRIKG